MSANMDSIDVRELGANETSPLTNDDLEFCKQTNDNTKHWLSTPFPINSDLNQKVVLYDGDLDLLRADALVNPTNENLTQLTLVNKLAGPELETHIRHRIKICTTGDVRVTPGFKSNFKFIIHAVPPKYQPKYKTAAETALFHTYFRVLETMIEKKLRTVVMPTLATIKCNLPIEENCELQLRIIRRFLEKKANNFDKIVVHVQSGSQYRLPFFCYFPRDQLDEEIACYHLEASVGGLNGEPVIPEREIRIKSKPAIFADQSIDLISGLDLSTVVGKTAFSKMHDDLDKQRSNMRTTISCESSSRIAIRKSVFRGCTLL